MLVATDDPVSISVDDVTDRNEANFETDKHGINATIVDSKSKCSYVFRLV
jgi:hypothetical protein